MNIVAVAVVVVVAAAVLVVVVVVVVVVEMMMMMITTTTCAEILPFSLASSEMQAQLLSVLLHSLGTFLPFLLQQLLIPVLIISSYHFSFFS
jgi:hypothetical protein